MSKYIIEIEDDFPFYDIPKDNVLYRAKGFNSLAFDKTGLDRLTKYEPFDEYVSEQRGAEKAWSLAGKICMRQEYGGMGYGDILECFGLKSFSGIFETPYSEIAAKYEAWLKWKEEEKIKVGG